MPRSGSTYYSLEHLPICLTAVSPGDDDAAAAVEVFRGRLQEERGHARAGDFLRHPALLALGDDPSLGLGPIGQLGGVDNRPVEAAGAQDFLTGSLVLDPTTHRDAGDDLGDGSEPVTRGDEGGQHDDALGPL